ncbi:hypothetical protein FIBSPDRAFT_573602 [Athelia psychrophila]|uniref:Uncharacterized protein n=1 Tax=Athelia psychrophila TaxID=1759441 RepID=A0A166HHV3_9AGAM|nr:hypothetical protein FIBSPDRAFT_573602 [Fibularhizoctonia sp. CBS 109695]
MASASAIFNTHGTSGGTVNNVNGSLTFQGDNHNIQGDYNNIQGNYQTFQGDQNNIKGNYQNFLGDNQNIPAGRETLGTKSKEALQDTRRDGRTGSSPPRSMRTLHQGHLLRRSQYILFPFIAEALNLLLKRLKHSNS